ncbi:hypothetical protein ACFSQJ_05995 [Croceitalea marina]|uniref:Uncharacterized protein n=1 Tax=Croceitalea marina TaxID=1775166 RepID=A0ABW5MVS1_9FLAO
MKKIEYFLYSLFTLLIFSCCPDVSPEIVTAEIEELEILNYEADEKLRLPSNQSIINSSAYAIIIIPNSPSLSEFEPQERNALFRSPDCNKTVDPSFVFEDNIVEVNITSSEDFYENQIGNQDVSALFEFAEILPTNEFGNGYVQIFTADRFSRFNEVIQSGAVRQGYENESLVSFFALKLNFFPIETITTTFTVEFIFESGRRLSEITPEVTIIP